MNYSPLEGIFVVALLTVAGGTAILACFFIEWLIRPLLKRLGWLDD